MTTPAPKKRAPRAKKVAAPSLDQVLQGLIEQPEAQAAIERAAKKAVGPTVEAIHAAIVEQAAMPPEESSGPPPAPAARDIRRGDAVISNAGSLALVVSVNGDWAMIRFGIHSRPQPCPVSALALTEETDHHRKLRDAARRNAEL